jgi:Flagellar hook-length control protein FliK
MSVGSISPVAGLAVASAASAPQAASDIAAVATQLVAEVTATLTEDLPSSLPTAPPSSALTTMVGQAATQQESLAPLLADLAVAVNSPAMPADARATAVQILAVQTPLDADVTAEQLQTATQNSGVFLEASLAAMAVNGAAAAPVDVQQDLKALLLQLTSELAPFVQAPTQAKISTSAQPPRGVAVRGSSDPLEPPVGGGPTTGQAAARPSLDPQVHTEALVRTLQQEAQGALARVQLSQAASVEQSGETTRWMFEVPIATPAGAGVAQFEISRDGRGPGSGGAAEPSWRARFSINAAPSGPVHADVLLGKDRVRVTLMAEDGAAQGALAAHQDELTQALAAEQGPDVAVRVIGGAPSRPRQPAGQLVDRRS